MNCLKSYIDEQIRTIIYEDGVVATPSNTMGMGNPMTPTDTIPGTEPIVVGPRKKRKHSKNKILSKIKESLLDDDDVFLDPENDKKDIENRIENWIKNNYFISGKLTISDDFVVDCSGEVSIKNENIESLTNGLFRWGKVKNYFDCSYCKKLTSLEGAPKEVGKSFSCKHCEKLTSLEGAPNEVGGDFDCSGCVNLKSLEGSPKSVGGNFDCNSCIKLESLKGAPKDVDWMFRCDFCDNLKSLKGAPEHVGWVFQCNYCKKLKITDSEREKYGLYI